MTSTGPSESSTFKFCCGCGDQGDANKQLIANLQEKSSLNQANKYLLTPPPPVKVTTNYILPKVHFTYSSPDQKQYFKNQSFQNSTKVGQSGFKSFFDIMSNFNSQTKQKDNKNGSIKMAQSSYKWIQSSKKEESNKQKFYETGQQKIFSNLSRQSRRSSRKSLHDHQQFPKQRQIQIEDLLNKKLGQKLKQ